MHIIYIYVCIRYDVISYTWYMLSITYDWTYLHIHIQLFFNTHMNPVGLVAFVFWCAFEPQVCRSWQLLPALVGALAPTNLFEDFKPRRSIIVCISIHLRILLAKTTTHLALRLSSKPQCFSHFELFSPVLEFTVHPPWTNPSTRYLPDEP